jgi:hypothetical protein
MKKLTRVQDQNNLGVIAYSQPQTKIKRGASMYFVSCAALALEKDFHQNCVNKWHKNLIKSGKGT